MRFWIGVKASYPPSAVAEAEAFLAAINAALEQRGLPSYNEPDDLSLVDGDHTIGLSGEALGDETLRGWGDVACFHRGFRLRGPRDLYLPMDFLEPLEVPFGRFLVFRRKALVGSYGMLQWALEDMAESLAIPFAGDTLADEVARDISECRPLRSSPHLAYMEEVDIQLRPVWLLYLNAFRLAKRHGCALCVSHGAGGPTRA